MDLDDLLEDLLDDLGLDDLGEDLRDRVRGARDRGRRGRRDAVDRARRTVVEQTRLPGVRSRLRRAALWGSVAYGSVMTAGAVALSTVGTGLNGWDAVALAVGAAALPAVPVGVWGARTRTRDRVQRHQEEARRTAREERAELPADVVGDWRRLRQAQALVSDLATEGLVDPAAVSELDTTAEQLRVLLVADRRARELGGSPSVPLRTQVAELADLLVALAVEAVEHRTEEVGAAPAPATLREATERLQSLRVARAEVERASAGGAGHPDLEALRDDADTSREDDEPPRRRPSTG